MIRCVRGNCVAALLCSSSQVFLKAGLRTPRSRVLRFGGSSIQVDAVAHFKQAADALVSMVTCLREQILLAARHTAPRLFLTYFTPYAKCKQTSLCVRRRGQSTIPPPTSRLQTTVPRTLCQRQVFVCASANKPPPHSPHLAATIRSQAAVGACLVTELRLSPVRCAWHGRCARGANGPC